MKLEAEFQNLIPPLTDEELAQLDASLLAEGCRDPLVVWEEQDTLLDGHNRKSICEAAGIGYRVVKISLSSLEAAKVWIIRNQFGRRNLTLYQRAELALKLKPLIAAAAKEQQKRKPGSVPPNSAEQTIDTREKLTKATGVGHDTIAKVEYLEANADEDTKAKARTGEISINKAYTNAKTKGQEEANAKKKAVLAKPVDGEYDIIVIDPPWPVKKIPRDCRPNQTKELDYPTMALPEIADIAIPAAADCHLFLWTTQRFLPISFEFLAEWGFKYVFTMVWHKPGGFQPLGLPQYNSEFCICGRKGTPKFVDTKAFNTCFNAPRGKHSEKPKEFYDLIRRVTDGRRLDMFSRRHIKNFDAWGNEA